MGPGCGCWSEACQRTEKEGMNTRQSEEVVPITQENSHYLESSPHTVKRKNRVPGPEFGRYGNRFHKSLGVGLNYGK
jgi:hypothetical protein